MSQRTILAVVPLALALLLACSPAEKPQPPVTETAPAPAPEAAAETAPVPTSVIAADVPEEALGRARTAADGLMTELRKELVAAMDAGGPLNAVSVCAERAPEIASIHQTDGLSIRRVSERVRNAGDRPDDYETAQLVRFAEARAADGAGIDELAEVVTGADGSRTLRYMKPIYIAKPCLHCHGDEAQMDPALLAKIRELYPQDEATGYAQGDLRGAVTVTVALR